MSYTIGDHLTAPYMGITHHGLFAGEDLVVHKGRDGVVLTSLEEFSGGNDISVCVHFMERKFTREESVERGLSRLGESEYNVIFDNCEHFVTWCIFGLESSTQVQHATIIAIETAWKLWKTQQKVPGPVVRYVAGAGLTQRLSGNPQTQAAGLRLLKSVVSGAGLASAGVGADAGVASTLVGGTAGITAGMATAAVVSGGTATTVIAGGAALTTVAAPVVAAGLVAAGLGYGVKKLCDWITD